MAATNRAKNDLQRVKGKTKEAVGEATGNRRLERKGKVDQAKGKARTWARSSRTQSAASSPLARVPQRAPRRTGTPPRISRRPDSQELMLPRFLHAARVASSMCVATLWLLDTCSGMSSIVE